MRIISQDGTIDIPYEQCVIQRFNESIYFLNENLTGVEGFAGDKMLASYSSKEKAENAMEMLQEQYMKLGMIKILASGTCEYMYKSLEKEEKMEIYTDYCRKHCFKFPKDEDVVV